MLRSTRQRARLPSYPVWGMRRFGGLEGKRIGTGADGCAYYPVNVIEQKQNIVEQKQNNSEKKQTNEYVLKIKSAWAIAKEAAVRDYLVKRWRYPFKIEELFILPIETRCNIKLNNAYVQECSWWITATPDCSYERFGGLTLDDWQQSLGFVATTAAETAAKAELERISILGLVYRFVVMWVVLNEIGLSHGDLHTGNIFVDEKGIPRLGDWSFAQSKDGVLKRPWLAAEVLAPWTLLLTHNNNALLSLALQFGTSNLMLPKHRNIISQLLPKDPNALLKYLSAILTSSPTGKPFLLKI